MLIISLRSGMVTKMSQYLIHEYSIVDLEYKDEYTYIGVDITR